MRTAVRVVAAYAVLAILALGAGALLAEDAVARALGAEERDDGGLGGGVGAADEVGRGVLDLDAEVVVDGGAAGAVGPRPVALGERGGRPGAHGADGEIDVVAHRGAWPRA